MYELTKLLSSSCKGDPDATMDLVNKFQPLLRKYKTKLNYEDAYNDLLLKFLELLSSFKLEKFNSPNDWALLLYIKTSMYHSFIALSKLHKKTSCVETIPISEENQDDDYMWKWDKLWSTTDQYLHIEFDFLYKALTKYEAEILIYHYYLKYPLKEIAQLYSVSLPAISKAKSNAIKKLREQLKKENSKYGQSTT